jgi:hypothetical protein
VRIVNRRERWAKRTLAAAIALPILYVLSFGPACWIAGRGNISEAAVERFYRPILLQLVHGPDRLNAPLSWYGSIGVPQRRDVKLRVMTLDGGIVCVNFRPKQ